MNWPGIVTVMAEIRDGLENEVAALVEQIDDQPCGRRQPFCDLPGLHCCALLIVPAEEGLPAYLVLEATFDGVREEFIHDLTDADFASAGGHTPVLLELFEKCVAFPQSARELPRSMADYLLAHAVRNNTFFSGVPGFPVARILAEQSLRESVREKLLKMSESPTPPPATYVGVLRQLRRELRAGDPALRLMEESSGTPWQVLLSPVFQPLSAVLLLLLLALIGVILAQAVGIGYAGLHGSVSEFLKWGGGAIAALWAALLFTLFRLAELRARSHDQSSFGAALHDIVAGSAGTFGFLAGLGFLAAASVWAASGLGGGVSVLLAVLALAVRWGLAVPLNMVLRRAAFPALLPARRSVLAAGRDTLVLLRRAALCVAVFALLAALGMGTASGVVLVWLTAVLVCVTLGMVVAFVVLASVFAWIWRLERREAANLLPATLLTTRTLGRAEVWEREEHGTNRSQNHFASVTWVKPGRLRLLLLRLTLWLVDIVAHHRDNRGRLGGIPTIVSARWLLIDGGRRLLFLTNYFGPWDSYLSEFSELRAKSGVNAIWANTMVRLDKNQAERFKTGEAREVDWPLVRSMLWGGAAIEEPFKAYVRQSQIPTRAWYGAYPDLSVPNIRENAQLRSVVFGTPTIAEIDDALDRI